MAAPALDGRLALAAAHSDGALFGPVADGQIEWRDDGLVHLTGYGARVERRARNG